MRTPVIFRHFRGVLDDGLLIEETAVWVGQYPPELVGYTDKLLVKWIDVEALRWLDRESLGRSIERVVTNSLNVGPQQAPGFEFEVSVRRTPPS